MPITLTRRTVLIGAACTTTMLAACATFPDFDTAPAIVFVHGNGDTAGLWLTTLWRFESNGWPTQRLHAIDMPYPEARDDDDVPQAGRSSSADCLRYLTVAIDQLLAATGARQVVLIANSRGGYAVRNYLAEGANAAKVSHAILGGTPNHGVWADANSRVGSEFNGAGAFLKRLNAPKGPGGDEVTPGPKWLTLRSDRNDKFAQPDGEWIGAKGTPTNVGFDGPALKGANNVVLAGADHRETSFSAAAFDAMHRFITGRAPITLDVVRQVRVRLDGKVSGYGVANAQGAWPSNLPLAGASLEVYACVAATGERIGAALHRKAIGADGTWGPFETDISVPLEFVITATGYATTHIYRSPFPRSSNIVNVRAERMPDADRGAAASVTLTRPRGYFGVPRDRFSLDGQSPAPGVARGVAGVSTSKVRLAEGAGRAITAEFNGERIVGRAWPAASNELTLLELHY